MASRIFVDTQGFYAWANAADATHDRATELLRPIRRKFLTTEWIVGETVNLFVARRKAHWGRRLFDFLERTSAVEVVAVGGEEFQASRRMFLDYEEHGLPFTDCTSFVTMQARGLVDALTSDRHYRIMGFNPLLAD